VILALLLTVAIDLGRYRTLLVEIDRRLEQGDPAGAAAAARALEQVTVRADGEELVTDLWALAPIARGEPHRARLRSLLASLEAPAAAGPAPDKPLLEALRAVRRWTPKQGGEIGEIDTAAVPFRDQLFEQARDAWRFVVRQVRRFLRWLGNLFPDQVARAPGASGSIVVPVLIGLAAMAIVMIVLALLSWGSGPPRPEQRLAGGTVADDDPLSRTAGGWEERARELAAAGRAREAIRAWYHAVLMRCASEGALYHRRGRTNWEYAHSLAPSLPWRARFADLTSRFDVEWYGRAESSSESLTEFSRIAGEILRALGRLA
jgi:hypothetical protein